MRTHRDEYTICNAAAPDAIFTRDQGIPGRLVLVPSLSANLGQLGWLGVLSEVRCPFDGEAAGPVDGLSVFGLGASPDTAGDRP